MLLVDHKSAVLTSASIGYQLVYNVCESNASVCDLAFLLSLTGHSSLLFSCHRLLATKGLAKNDIMLKLIKEFPIIIN